MRVLLFLLLFIVTGCSKSALKYSVARALSPEPHADFEALPKVESLTPTLKWTLLEEAEPEYTELIVWPLSLIPLRSNQYACPDARDVSEDFSECHLTGEQPCKVIGEQYKVVVTKFGSGGGSAKAYAGVICGDSGPYYYREVRGNSHTIERTLDAKSRYMWTIRPVWKNQKEATGVGSYWSSTYNHVYWVGGNTWTRKFCKNCLFMFETP